MINITSARVHLRGGTPVRPPNVVRFWPTGRERNTGFSTSRSGGMPVPYELPTNGALNAAGGGTTDRDILAMGGGGGSRGRGPRPIGRSERYR